MTQRPDLLGPGTWIQPGPASLLVRPGGWVVLVPGLRKEVIEAAWTVLGQDVGAEKFLDRLIEQADLEGPEKITAILFGMVDGDTVTYGVKGRTPIAVYTADGAQLVAGTDDEPFVLKSFSAVRRVAFGELPPEDHTGLPRIETGITRLRGFVQVLTDPAELDDESRAALAAQIEAHGRSIEDPEAKQRKAQKPAPTTPAPAAAAPARKPMLATRKPGEMPPSLARGGGTSSAAAEPAAPAGPSVFDNLFEDQKPQAAPAAPAAPAIPSPPQPAAAPEPAAPSAGESAPASEASVPAAEAPQPRRRLVSTSLFDRRRRPVDPPSTTEAAPAPTQPAATPAPTQPEATPAPAAAPEPVAAPEHTGAAQPGAAAAQVPSPTVEDEESPITLIAPIDDGEGPEDETYAEEAQTPRGTPPHTDAPAPTGAPSGLGPRPRSGVKASMSVGGMDTDLDSTGAYDDLFGKTVFRSIEDAAVRKSEDAAGEAAEAEPQHDAPDGASSKVPSRDLEQTVAPVEEPDEFDVHDPSQPAPAATSGGDFIDWVPGVGRQAPEIAQTAARRAATPQQPADSSAPPYRAQVPAPQYPAQPQAPQYPAQPPVAQYPDQTPAAPYPEPQQAPRYPAQPLVNPLAAQPPMPPAPQAPAAAPQAPAPSAPYQQHAAAPGAAHRPGAAMTALPGLLCPSNHPNSPERSQCVICRVPLPGPIQQVQRPPLGVVDISTGGTFLLDRTAIIGRRPRASRVSGNDVPQLITVPSPQQDISRSHLELRLEGWHVVAIDLGTTNGTTMHREGTEPMRLRSREATVLRDGDVLDLGDGVMVRMRETA